MIKSNMAKQTLEEMLKKANVRFNKPDCLEIWGVFKKFSNIKVKCSDDAMLFQCESYNFRGEEFFTLGYVRQFIFEIDGEYDYMEQLEITIFFKSNQELKGFETSVWTYDCNSKNEFFNLVENMKEFKIPIEKYTPIQFIIEQEEV
ncbi:hypothetical protein [Chengkuizengella marina]|uniref:Uncharacterized protein n=1 Tax=Chengkuizengella marina TaxID=2507566 RepID=A0A6N9Q0Z9_9BACL|nr:hypothetical protein [Chengkuizengella marina]NBI29007.1 hypothetical protein [Chengkuizengella marina]